MLGNSYQRLHICSCHSVSLWKRLFVKLAHAAFLSSIYPTNVWQLMEMLFVKDN